MTDHLATPETAADVCPDPTVHGNPFRYCPFCDWTEDVVAPAGGTPLNPEPRTLSQRTLASRLRAAYQDGTITAIGLEAAEELDRLTHRPDITSPPAPALLEQLAALDTDLGTAAHDEILRLRQIIRSLVFDCESHEIPRYPGIRLNIPTRLWNVVRDEARRR